MNGLRWAMPKPAPFSELMSVGESASAPRYLHSVRGVGVRLAAPPDRP